ncbi:copper-binding protein [Caenimonas sedimenti]|uniref:Copper-binding protein n=2 Tax=Caenimonas sedimenti TaxID=2596921 RepID=A0A562ZHP9_9BURK|nr:copper-binding protein [Caenimonas sedimenti]
MSFRQFPFAPALFAAAVFSVASGVATAAADTQASASASTATAAKLTSGEVRKVDVEQGKLTIKHEAIANLDMPAMTMVFKAGKPDLLKNIQAGDKIEFRAESVAGAFVVTEIKPAK